MQPIIYIDPGVRKSYVELYGRGKFPALLTKVGPLASLAEIVYQVSRLLEANPTARVLCNSRAKSLKTLRRITQQSHLIDFIDEIEAERSLKPKTKRSRKV